MAALERKPVRINGFVSADTDEALFDALEGVSLYKRMALLRRLANLGLMVEQGRLAGAPLVALTAAESLRTVAAFEAPQAVRKAEPTAPPTQVVPEPKVPVPDRVVTATAEKRSDADASDSNKPRGPNLSLMRRMNLSIMD